MLSAFKVLLKEPVLYNKNNWQLYLCNTILELSKNTDKRTEFKWDDGRFSLSGRVRLLSVCHSFSFTHPRFKLPLLINTPFITGPVDYESVSVPQPAGLSSCRQARWHGPPVSALSPMSAPESAGWPGGWAQALYFHLSSILHMEIWDQLLLSEHAKCNHERVCLTSFVVLFLAHIIQIKNLECSGNKKLRCELPWQH